MFRAFLAILVAVLLTGCTIPDAAARPTPPEVRATPAATATVVWHVPTGVTCQWARVRGITDGDTIRVDFEGGLANQPVRYIGIDTPETVHPTLGKQPFGLEASAENTRLVAGKRVCLEKDVSERDRYDRSLRYVWLPDGSMVNEQLVLAGLATVDTFPPDVKYVDVFIAAQVKARDAGRGIWAP